MLLVLVAAQRQPRLGAWRRLRHRPAVVMPDVLGALPVGTPTVAEVVLGLAVALLALPVTIPLGWRGAGLLAVGDQLP